ncbi:hypothetical protein MKW92_034773 [Papaver armeniacum]|nr:hypothetical protein MKW92_034773 [Papaver armeniacum]
MHKAESPKITITTAAMSEVASQNTVFYAIFPDEIHGLASPWSDSLTEDEYQGITSTLFSLHLRILDIISSYITDYTWEHEPFTLYPSTINNTPNPNLDNVPCLHGQTRFGTNFENEWFIVFLLTEISRKIRQVTVRVWDSHGEFLLFENASFLPSWLTPETSKNRVFIRFGEVSIVHQGNMSLGSRLIEILGFSQSPTFDVGAPMYVRSAFKNRISEYPERVKLNMHQIRVQVPISIAKVLQHEPCLISLAIEGFCNRDDGDLMKLNQKMETFLKRTESTVDGDKKEELVRVSVRMSRAMYVKLVNQKSFEAPKCYPIPPKTDSSFYVETLLGMKITCGFEIMYQKSIREGRGGKGIATLESFKESLKKNGYFKGLPSGSNKRRRLTKRVEQYYLKSSVFSRERETMNGPVSRIDEILLLPNSSVKFKGLGLLPSDDDAWLYDEEDKSKLAMLERQKQIELFEFKSKAKKDIEKTCADQSTEEGSSSESDSDWDGVPFGYDSDFSYDDFTNPFLDIYNEDSDDEFNPLEVAILVGLMGGLHPPNDRRRRR